MTEMNRYFSVLNASQASDRARLDRQVEDVARVLQGGGQATIPEGDIRRLRQPAEADAILDRLATAQIAGDIGRTVAMATPEEIDQTRQDLASGTGPGVRDNPHAPRHPDGGRHRSRGGPRWGSCCQGRRCSCV